MPAAGRQPRQDNAGNNDKRTASVDTASYHAHASGSGTKKKTTTFARPAARPAIVPPTVAVPPPAAASPAASPQPARKLRQRHEIYCPKCKTTQHESSDCPALHDMASTPAGRMLLKQWLAAWDRCICCWRPAFLHPEGCPSSCRHCGQKHHSALHSDAEPVETPDRFYFPTTPKPPKPDADQKPWEGKGRGKFAKKK